LLRLLQELATARADGRYPRLLNTYARTNLLVLDDWGLSPLTDEQRKDLFEILEDRYDILSTLVTSQLPIPKWHQIIGDPSIADALLDRLVHNAHKLTLKGESMRKKHKHVED
jgi:DNA replication protein DnaC